MGRAGASQGLDPGVSQVRKQMPSHLKPSEARPTSQTQTVLTDDFYRSTFSSVSRRAVCFVGPALFVACVTSNRHFRCFISAWGIRSGFLWTELSDNICRSTFHRVCQPVCFVGPALSAAASFPADISSVMSPGQFARGSSGRDAFFSWPGCFGPGLIRRLSLASLRGLFACRAGRFLPLFPLCRIWRDISGPGGLSLCGGISP